MSDLPQLQPFWPPSPMPYLQVPDLSQILFLCFRFPFLAFNSSPQSLHLTWWLQKKKLHRDCQNLGSKSTWRFIYLPFMSAQMQFLQTIISLKMIKNGRLRDMVYLKTFQCAALILFCMAHVCYVMKAARQHLNHAQNLQAVHPYKPRGAKAS